MISTSQPSAARVYNDLILSYCLLALNKLKLLDALSSGVSLRGLVASRQLDERRLREILKITTAMAVTSQHDDSYRLTEVGDDLRRHIGFFTWAIGGYSPLLESMDTLTIQPEQSWRPYVRGEHVAIGSDECHRGIMEPIVNQVIDALPATCVADLGCGNAGRLVEFLRHRPALSGVGIDIDAQAITAAAAHIATHNLTDRVTLVTQDVFSALQNPSPQLAQVDLVLSFMMLHDLFSQQRSGEVLFKQLRAAFPNARYFALADTCLDDSGRSGNQLPVFTSGYELVHAMRGIVNFPLSFYEEEFRASGLKLKGRHPLGVPNTYLFILEAP